LNYKVNVSFLYLQVPGYFNFFFTFEAGQNSDICSHVMIKCCKLLLLLFMLAAGGVPLSAQKMHITGFVKDLQNDEPVPFATIQLLRSGKGTLTDSAGYFSFAVSDFTPDTLSITSVGFKAYFSFIRSGRDTFRILAYLDKASLSNEVVVRAKTGNRGLLVWKRIVKNKPINDRAKFDNFGYELYNKLEIDWNKFNRDKAKKIPFIKSFSFVFDNVDTTETTPFLPVYLTETISDYYYQRSPKKFKEVIKAQKADGIENESMSKFLGGMYQNINVYNNFLPVFDKDYASPLSDNGDVYYNYKVADTQYMGGRRFYHLLFAPRHKGENAFEGDCWVDALNYAIQKITLKLPKEANINYVEQLSMIQEFAFINDSTWFLIKDKFVADFYLVGKKTLNFKGRKTTTYRNIHYNQPFITDTLALAKTKEEIIIMPNSRYQEKAYWQNNRHEKLSKNEESIYKMIDTLTNLPRFKKITNTLNFLATGYKNIGNVEIGPWYNWITANNWEGTRFRFDLGTNQGFSRKYYIHGYLAYGTGDKRIKGKAEIYNFLTRYPRNYFHLSYKNDIDNGQTYFDEIGTDNIFALAVRKNRVPIKFMNIEEIKIEYFNEWKNGLSALLTFNNRNFTPLQNLPSKDYFTTKLGNALNNAEVTLKLRYAYLERFIESGFFRTSLGSDFPIAELRISKGLSGVFKSSYDYTKMHLGLSDYVKLAPYGSLYFNVYGGKIFGTLPYMLLEIPPGNEIYYYNKYAFNLMNRFEFITDRYAGFTVEHNIGNGLFSYFGPTRKLKWRQFWNAKGLVGGLTPENEALNFKGNYPYSNLNSRLYLEIGTGVDNIFKLLRIDFVWRVAPAHLPTSSIKNFGVFGSFRLGF
jgi:Family of unknown function (DUF5686)/CarboxypepD_reg-like domain